MFFWGLINTVILKGGDICDTLKEMKDKSTDISFKKRYYIFSNVNPIFYPASEKNDS